MRKKKQYTEKLYFRKTFENGNLLSNPHIIDYLSNIFEDSKKHKNPVKPMDVIKILQSKPYIEDKEIVEELKNMDANLLAKDKKILSNIRYHLIKLHQEGIVNYERETNAINWIFYKWYFNSEGLKNSYISRLNEKLEAIESANNENGRYFCGKDETHPQIDFNYLSHLDDDNFRCEECNSALVFKTGEELLNSANPEIDELKKAIEDVKKIEV